MQCSFKRFLLTNYQVPGKSVKITDQEFDHMCTDIFIFYINAEHLIKDRAVSSSLDFGLCFRN